MIPVHMGIMTQAPAVLVPTSVSVVSKPPVPRKEPLLPIPGQPKQAAETGGPTTTVFVGNIEEKASDMLIRQLLAKCGIVLSWKRVQGASGKLQAFGFCEYKEPESTLRSLRLLHELQIGEKKLLVKVDAKTKAQLDEWKAKKRSAKNGKPVAVAENGDDEDEPLDEETKKKDVVVKAAIDGLMREFASELKDASSGDGEGQRLKTVKTMRKEKKGEEDINAIDMEDDKRDLISREISKFRDTHKKLEEEKDKKEKERAEFERERREREKERERERERRDREREKEKERERERERDRERDMDRERDRDRERRTKPREWERSRERSMERSRSRDREMSRDRDRDDRKEKKRDRGR